MLELDGVGMGEEGQSRWSVWCGSGDGEHGCKTEGECQ